MLRVANASGAILWQGLLAASLISSALAAGNGKAATSGQPVKVFEDTLQFYVAKGEPDACGAGCSEWIAVEGRIEKGASGRLRAFLKQTKNPRLPVYFHSPGGSEGDGLAIGRMLREHGMTVGVARTVPLACLSDKGAACRAARQSHEAVPARWVSLDAYCNSSCVYALIGGKVRDVPAGARVGVHSSKLVEFTYGGREVDLSVKHLPVAIKARIDALKILPRKYVREMGIGEELNEAIAATPYESIKVLSRAEIMRFGIDRRQRHETGWMMVEDKLGEPTLVKIVTEAREGSANVASVSVVRILCRPGGQIASDFFGSMWPDDRAAATAARFVVGGRATEFSLNRGTMKADGIEPGSALYRHFTIMPKRFFDEAATQENFEIVETIKAEGKAVDRKVTLSTVGLSAALNSLRGACRTGSSPEIEEQASRQL